MPLVLRTLLFAALAIATGGWAADDLFVGTWVINVSKSQYSPDPPPKSGVQKVERMADGVRVTFDGTGANGRPLRWEYTAKYDGKDYPVASHPDRDAVSLRQIDPFTNEMTSKKAGRVTSTSRRVMAKDGKSFTIIQQGVNSRGQPVSNVIVYERQSD